VVAMEESGEDLSKLFHQSIFEGLFSFYIAFIDTFIKEAFEVVRRGSGWEYDDEAPRFNLS
jgi:hypothetical protein